MALVKSRLKFQVIFRLNEIHKLVYFLHTEKKKKSNITVFNVQSSNYCEKYWNENKNLPTRVTQTGQQAQKLLLVRIWLSLQGGWCPSSTSVAQSTVSQAFGRHSYVHTSATHAARILKIRTRDIISHCNYKIRLWSYTCSQDTQYYARDIFVQNLNVRHLQSESHNTIFWYTVNTKCNHNTFHWYYSCLGLHATRDSQSKHSALFYSKNVMLIFDIYRQRKLI
mgnify:CR=1 FL=1